MSEDLYSNNVENIENKINTLKQDNLENYTDIASDLNQQAQEKVSEYMDKWKSVQDAGLDDLAGVMGVKGMFKGGKQVYQAYKKFKARNKGQGEEGESVDDSITPSNPNTVIQDADQLGDVKPFDLVGDRLPTGKSLLSKVNVETDLQQQLQGRINKFSSSDFASGDDFSQVPTRLGTEIGGVKNNPFQPISRDALGDEDLLDTRGLGSLTQADAPALGEFTQPGGSLLGRLTGNLPKGQTPPSSLDQQPLKFLDDADIPDVPGASGMKPNLPKLDLPDPVTKVGGDVSADTGGVLDGIFGEGASAVGDVLASTGEIGLAVGGLVAIGEGLYHLFHEPSSKAKTPSAPELVAPVTLTQKYSSALPSVDNSIDRSGAYSF